MLGLGQTPRKRATETPSRGVLLGLDIGAFSLKAVRISSSRAGIRLEQVRNVSYGQPLAANDAQASLDRISTALKEARLQGSRWKPTPIACTLPLCMTQMRLLDAPCEDGVDEEDYILRELAAENSDREEPWLGDHWPTQSSTAADAHSPMGIVGARRSWVEELIACFEELGLEPRIIDGAPFAIARALRKSDSRNDDIQAGLDLGYEGALFVLVRRGVPTYFRMLRGCGMRGVLEAIRNGLHIEEREAHQFLKACAQASRRPSAASKTMIATLMELAALPLRRLQNELARTLDFARRQSDANELKRITLFGGGSLFPGIASLLEGWADLDFRQFTLKLDELSEADQDSLPLLAHAISLAEISTPA
jgi:Tfp pilus assembly PilM family ATPase